MIKKGLLGLLCGFGLCALPAFAGPTTDIYHNGQLLDTTQPVLNIQDRTMIGFRDYFEAVQAEVHWDDASRTATTSYEAMDFLILPDTGVVMANGQKVDLDVPPQLIEGRIYLPLRFFSEAMGYEVGFEVLGPDHFRVDLTESKVPEVEVPAPVLPDKALIFPRPQDYPGSAGYYLAEDKLVEVGGYQGSVKHRTVDQDGQAAVLTFKGAGNQIVRDVYVANGEPVILKGLPQNLPAPYVGPGLPTYTKPFATLDTSLGDAFVYGTDIRASAYVFRQGKLAHQSLNGPGLVLEMAQAFDPAKARWAKEGESQAALVEGTLLIFDQDRLYQDTPTPATDFVTSKNTYYTIGVQGQTFSIGAYDSQGQEKRPYKEATSLAGSGPLYLRDSLDLGDTFYLLVANDTHSQVLALDTQNPNKMDIIPLGQNLTFTSLAQDLAGGLYAVAPLPDTYLVAPISP